ncbi:PilZ domain-containing protein [Paenibacillus sp. y28]|uniref:PilZ domain-containing protein n=1 Tax=Paenibacillus sp. y28 TaxID=3129110 RepID=UPI003018D03E
MNQFHDNDQQLSYSILLDCRAVVERNDYVSTGILSYAEGDLLEVELTDYQRFQLGDVVKITIYTPAGRMVFRTSIIAIDDGSILILHPPDNQKKFNEKREHPRVMASGNGRLVGFGQVSRSSLQAEQEAHVQVAVQNVSLNGVGFVHDETVELGRYELHMELGGGEITCKVDIVRREPGEEGVYYGARIVDIPATKANSLRAYILRRQLESHTTSKKNRKQEGTKRIFKT